MFIRLGELADESIDRLQIMHTGRTPALPHTK